MKKWQSEIFETLIALYAMNSFEWITRLSTLVRAARYACNACKKSSKHSNDVDDEKDRILRQLQQELLDARCEMQSLSESKVRLANFQAVIETQTFTIDELRNEVRLLRSRQNVLSDKMSETKLSEGNLSENKIHNFVSHIKSTVDELGLASQAIDSEFAAI